MPNCKKKRKAQTALHHLRLLSVIPLRFERRTHALEGRCSIQLSYGTNLFLNCGAKVVLSDGICKCFGIFFLKKAKKAVRPYLTKNNTDNM